MITINIINVSILVLVGIIIWFNLPKDYKNELGTFVGIIIELLWLILWLIIFPILGHGINISFY